MNIKKSDKILILGILLIVILIKSFVIDRYNVNGDSMNPLLKNSDFILTNKLDKNISRYDIVVIKTNNDVLRNVIVKRIIGLPNEKIIIKNGKVYINNHILEDDIFAGFIENAGLASTEITLNNDEYFVLGDNRNQSEDSRVEWVGNIRKEQIIGKVIFKTFPLPKKI